MSLLNFSDALEKAGIDPKKTVLIRHSLNDKLFKECYDADQVQEYTSHQSENFHKGAEYWAVFINDYGTMAKFHSIYRVEPSVEDSMDTCPDGFPECVKKLYRGENIKYNLERLDCLAEYEKRLIIGWGGGTVQWHQWATNEKPITMIYADHTVFPGYDNVLLSYDELKEIVDDEAHYPTWHTSLSSLYGIYLIVDKKIGRQYVGSAYGKDGVLGRWKSYAATGHGGNKKMIELLSDHPERIHDLQFSILRVLPKTITNEEAIEIESLYKKKLCSIQFGMNDN